MTMGWAQDTAEKSYSKYVQFRSDELLLALDALPTVTSTSGHKQ